MKISNFKTNMPYDSFSLNYCFNVVIIVDEFHMFTDNSSPISESDRMEAFGRFILSEISKNRIKEISDVK